MSKVNLITSDTVEGLNQRIREEVRNITDIIIYCQTINGGRFKYLLQ